MLKSIRIYLASLSLFAAHCFSSDFVEFVDARVVPEKSMTSLKTHMNCGGVSSVQEFKYSLSHCPEEIYRLKDTISDYTAIAINNDDINLTCVIGRYHLGHFSQHINYTEALRVFNISSRHANLNAYFYLGQLYEYGNGVSRDEEVAFAFYSVSLLRGSLYAQEVRSRLSLLSKIIRPSATDDIKRFITEKYELAMMVDSMRFEPTFMIGIRGDYHKNYCS